MTNIEQLVSDACPHNSHYISSADRTLGLNSPRSSIPMRGLAEKIIREGINPLFVIDNNIFCEVQDLLHLKSHLEGIQNKEVLKHIFDKAEENMKVLIYLAVKGHISIPETGYDEFNESLADFYWDKAFNRIEKKHGKDSRKRAVDIKRYYKALRPHLKNSVVPLSEKLLDAYDSFTDSNFFVSRYRLLSSNAIRSKTVSDEDIMLYLHAILLKKSNPDRQVFLMTRDFDLMVQGPFNGYRSPKILFPNIVDAGHGIAINSFNAYSQRRKPIDINERKIA